ncbi:hypothetical protein KFL_009820020 [Klebsormidium nitens]|uniref:Uncharacterized protein n=1 Tax=Klebsormidium nitens TaxID=105231 RepID=A0A1Y1ISS4_KLENI|nr:hypothetical protein KFL_009820020 [Klebsormidium nitens]|eukprot:GAQ92331.1 hypothetical protein KFL_009820020 [Klebsormidium nitens]
MDAPPNAPFYGLSVLCFAQRIYRSRLGGKGPGESIADAGAIPELIVTCSILATGPRPRERELATSLKEQGQAKWVLGKGRRWAGHPEGGSQQAVELERAPSPAEAPAQCHCRAPWAQVWGVVFPKGEGDSLVFPQGEADLWVFPQVKGNLRVFPQGDADLRVFPLGEADLRVYPRGEGDLRAWGGN